MFLVLGRILGRRANSSAPLLSSKTVQCILGGKSSTLTPCARASVRSPIRGITSLKLVESAMYSASVVDMAVMVCILDAHYIGAPAKRTIQPERDLAVMGSLCASAWRQLPAKSASTQQSNCLDLFGCMMMPLSLVASRYRPIRFTASAWLFLGDSEKRAHWWKLTECWTSPGSSVSQLRCGNGTLVACSDRRCPYATVWRSPPASSCAWSQVVNASL